MVDLLKLEHVSKSFESLLAVNEVSFSVEPGQVVGLIGPNGSGKSTLLSLIAGTLSADSGRITFDGQDITHRSADQIFQLGLVRSFQDPSLFFRMTVLDNSLLPVKHQTGENPVRAPFHRLWSGQESNLAAAAGKTLAELQLSQHYTARASDLSGGQMKLLELGRSLMGEPKLLLLDEPTAGVAPKLAYTIFEEIKRLRQSLGLTFVIVEHRLEILFDFVDTVFVMHAGSLLAHGTPAEISANAEVREIYFGE
ncbi:MAG: ABC transporter ATP-binding protein [Anaerolineae bacterium]|nr:ABC transporter ATP-binding protein [Anaerolineales bacterium]MCQ3978666.1 ABC transporter ATP-binding protein [Anaerolineae bacterium]